MHDTIKSSGFARLQVYSCRVLTILLIKHHLNIINKLSGILSSHDHAHLLGKVSIVVVPVWVGVGEREWGNMHIHTQVHESSEGQTSTAIIIVPADLEGTVLLPTHANIYLTPAMSRATCDNYNI